MPQSCASSSDVEKMETVRGIVNAAPPLDETFSADELSPNTRFPVKPVSKKGYARSRHCNASANIRSTDFQLFKKLVQPLAKNWRSGLHRSNVVFHLETLVSENYEGSETRAESGCTKKSGWTPWSRKRWMKARAAVSYARHRGHGGKACRTKAGYCPSEADGSEL